MMLGITMVPIKLWILVGKNVGGRCTTVFLRVKHSSGDAAF